MKGFLEKHLKIYSHETHRFLWISAICFVIFFVFAIFRTFVDASFLKRYGPQYIPIMLVINALITFVVMGVVDQLSRKFLDYFLLAFLLGGYAVSTGILYFTVQADYSISYPILYQLMHLLDSFLLVYLWNMAGDLFDARQGKRIFPLITASQVLGTTLGSFLTKPLTLAIGENPTLLVFGATCLVTGVYLWKTGSEFFAQRLPKSVAASKASSVRITEVPGIMIKYPIVRYLIITGLIPNILLPIFLYQFNVIANQTFPSEQSLIAFLSIFRGMTTMTTFVLLFFMGRLYSSMGLTNASLVHPINFSILFTSLTAFFNIYVASYGQFSVILIQRAIAGPVNKILYNIIPSELVSWSRTFIRGTVLKVGMLAGSLLMIALKPVLSAKMLSPIAAVLAIYWVIETLFFRKHYKRILKQVIVEKQIDFDEIESIRGVDPAGSVMALASVPMEDRSAEGVPSGQEQRIPEIDPEVALKLLDDESPQTRAEAAASFGATRDVRAVAKLVNLLGDTDDDVRQAAIESLMTYRHAILPFLEVSLTQATPRARQGILEVLRLSGLTEFEMTPFLGSELTRAYGNLIALRGLQSLDGALSVELLRGHLKELNEEILSLIFYALWVSHADMRLMYEALKSETASLAVELVESSIRKEFVPYLIPLIEDIPLDEKIERGKRLLPLIKNETMDRVLTLLADSYDPVTRMLALFVIGDQVHQSDFIPIIQSHLTDEAPYVRELADYALKRCTDEVAVMPDIIERITRLKAFGIFEGMGVRELHAIASVVHDERFAPGDVMIKEGEENSSIYLVIAGSVTIYEGFGTENQREKVTIGAGSFLGELSLFTRQPPNATCVAAETTDAYVLRHHQFQEIMRVYPQIGINLCRFFTMKLRQLAY
jgi:hypothetical protein